MDPTLKVTFGTLGQPEPRWSSWKRYCWDACTTLRESAWAGAKQEQVDAVQGVANVHVHFLGRVCVSVYCDIWIKKGENVLLSHSSDNGAGRGAALGHCPSKYAEAGLLIEHGTSSGSGNRDGTICLR